jgi:hypothetical protein
MSFISDTSRYLILLDGLPSGEDPKSLLISCIYDDNNNVFGVVKICKVASTTEASSSSSEGSLHTFTPDDVFVVDSLTLVAFHNVKKTDDYDEVRRARERFTATLEISRQVNQRITGNLKTRVMVLSTDISSL